MTLDDGDGKKVLPELTNGLYNIYSEDLIDGVKREQVGTGEDTSQLNRSGEDAKDGGGDAVQAQGVAPVSQQRTQGTGACWERFLHLRSIKVLLVENDDSTRHVVTALLRNCNYEVMEAANGLHAWKILEDLTNHIDLVLTEVVMPCLSGIGLLCKIMSHKTRKNIPVIMMSPHDSMGLVFKCLSKGAVDFLVKPIRKNELKNLWQHVWRRCHSSSGSGSGSESGTQTQKSSSSKSSERSDNESGSNDTDKNGSIGLNIRDGSDSGSGIQSSWTKQAVEVHSSQAVPICNQMAEHPDSTCAQVVRPSVRSSGNKSPLISATMNCLEQGEHLVPENIAEGKELVTGGTGTADLQSDCAIEGPPKLPSRKLTNLSEMDYNTISKEIHEGDPNPNGENPSAKYKAVITNTSDPQMDNRRVMAPKGLAKALDMNDKVNSDSRGLSAPEVNLKRSREVKGAGKTARDDSNVLRHSELSAFSRYNVSSIALKDPSENKGSSSPMDNSLKCMKKMAFSNQPLYWCSNIVSNNMDMGSTTNKGFADPVAFKDKSEAKSHATVFNLSSSLKPPNTDLVCNPQQVIAVKATEGVTSEMLTPPGGSQQELPTQHLHHHCNDFQKDQLQPPSNHEDMSFNKLATDAPHCGSSNIKDGPTEGNAGNYSLNRSATGSNHGSNHGSNGQNGSSTAVIAGGTNTGGVNVAAGKNGSGDASGSGSANNIDQSRITDREALLNKFHQKRKERCFQKKVRYQSRKRLAEKRPRVRGQFVRHLDIENSSSAADS